MILIACLDDNLGMLFNHRRQSQDRLLRRHILTVTAGRPLWVSPYTARQFAPAEQGRLQVAENPLAMAGEGEFCFTESGELSPYEDRLERLLLYRWNRRYPADVVFPLALTGGRWRLVRQTDFPGYSHETITEELYIL